LDSEDVELGSIKFWRKVDSTFGIDVKLGNGGISIVGDNDNPTMSLVNTPVNGAPKEIVNVEYLNQAFSSFTSGVNDLTNRVESLEDLYNNNVKPLITDSNDNYRGVHTTIHADASDANLPTCGAVYQYGKGISDALNQRIDDLLSVVDSMQDGNTNPGTSNADTDPLAGDSSTGANLIPFHNSYPRCKYLGTSITDAQNEAIKNRTYDDLFIGDYWTINDVNWRIVAIDYYYNVGDTNNFDKGNIIVMPDTVLYNTQMSNTTDSRDAYGNSLMRTQNLNDARTIAQNTFGSHLANHRIYLASAFEKTSGSISASPTWQWYNSDGVELPTEAQIYGKNIRSISSFDSHQQFPLMVFAPQFVNISQNYWLQDVATLAGSMYFAFVSSAGNDDRDNATSSFGVRPSVTLSYI
jgi:hypothetical protein